MRSVGSRGFSLLEVLVTILLTAIGILGMVAMQGKAIQYTQDSVERTHAVMLANELMEIIRSSPSSLQSSADDSPLFDSLPAGATTGCLAIDDPLLETQVACWAARVRMLLPDADKVSDVFVACTSTTPGTCHDDGAAIEIRLAWSAAGEGCLDAAAEDSDNTLCTYTFRSQI
ncbi:MAG: type IV pilus modification protein PilV [Pseudomonas profundi]|uniref:type IV pilus modification protein PilV n=1 Tax=Pseudomonas profundi TaxID=1981513 RepID=UPI0030028E1A